MYSLITDGMQARAALSAAKFPLVIKADGLCAGKGVLVTNAEAEAAVFVDRLLDGSEFGSAGKSVLLEEALEGVEL